MSTADTTTTTITLLLLGYCIAVIIWRYVVRRYLTSLPYPPGPRAEGWLSGNAGDLPSTFPWLSYTQWSKTYGSIVHFRAFNQHFIVLNNIDSAVELLEKRANVYSSRPSITMWDLMGFSYTTTLRDYSPEWRKHRRVFQHVLRYDAAVTYRPTQTKKINDMLYGLLTSPDEFEAHIQTASGAIIMSVMYGYDVQPQNDKFVELEERTQEFVDSGPALTCVVNAVPVLRHIPAWFPGAGFKRYAASAHKFVVDQRELPFNYALNIASTDSRISVVSSLLDTYRSDSDLLILKEVTGSAYGAGTSTTMYTILGFIVAMILHPDVQKRAQNEIDSTTGGDRLVDYDDRTSLPYLEATFREVFRWRPVAPLGIPHLNKSEDFYNGYRIPSDTFVIPNIWAMTRDPTKYADPEAFNPNRFLDENGDLIDDNVGFVFGFGRRICPGRHLASASVWLAMVRLLQTFNLHHKINSEGYNVPVSDKYSDGLLSRPLPFKCSITPRNDKARRLILDTRIVM